MNYKNKKKIHRLFVIIIIIILVVIAGSLLLKYQVEGEQNMPFNLSRIMVISSAQGIQKENSEQKWDLELIQNNDIYFDLTKNKNYHKTELIDKIIFDHFTIENAPQKGELVITKLVENEVGIKPITEEYLVKDSLEYVGNEHTDLANLQISNQGGLILLRFINQNLGTYTSNEEEEIKHDGTLLGKMGITNEEIKTKIAFDMTILLKSEKQYKANIKLVLPIGDVITQGTTNFEDTKLKEVVFKRQ